MNEAVTEQAQPEEIIEVVFSALIEGEVMVTIKLGVRNVCSAAGAQAPLVLSDSFASAAVGSRDICTFLPPVWWVFSVAEIGVREGNVVWVIVSSVELVGIVEVSQSQVSVVHFAPSLCVR